MKIKLSKEQIKKLNIYIPYRELWAEFENNKIIIYDKNGNEIKRVQKHEVSLL